MAESYTPHEVHGPGDHPLPGELLRRFQVTLGEAGFPDAALYVGEWREPHPPGPSPYRPRINQGWACICAHFDPRPGFAEAWTRACCLIYGIDRKELERYMGRAQ